MRRGHEGVGKIRRHRHISPESEESCRPPRVGVDVFLRHRLSYLRYDRSKNTDPRSLSTSTATITGPDRNRRHRIVSALSLQSRRAAGGLRRPSKSRALLAFPRLSLPGGWAGPNNQRSFKMRNSMMQWRKEDPKTSAQTAGIRGIVPYTSRRVTEMDSFDIILLSQQICSGPFFF